MLIGFALLLMFGLYQALIRSGIIPPITQQIGCRIVQTVLRGGFMPGLFVIVLGFGLQFYNIDVYALPSVNVDAIADKLIEKSESPARAQAQLASLEQQNEVWKQQAHGALQALADLRGRKDSGPGVSEALACRKQGKTKKAEDVFQTIAQRNEAHIAAHSKKAAAAYRHLGALAFLKNSQKALHAYRRATEIDPYNAIGWSQLASVFLRHNGRLSQASTAICRVLARKARHDRSLFAKAYGYLGELYYWTGGDLDQVKVMYRMAREIHKLLGKKETMTSDYTIFGNNYGMRGDLDQAGTM
ncbi:MAG: hypothetical protein M3294_00055, partial [Pseudomonadota bacterium]|nr:hypothetical protein [Pseudomonadota bacterium]